MILNRYMSLEKFRKMTRGFFIPKASKFNDWWEGLFPFYDEEGNFHNPSDNFSLLKSYMEWMCISCWNLNADESYAMWRIYGNWKDDDPRNTPAVLVQVDDEKFKTYLNNHLETMKYYGQVFDVEYLNPKEKAKGPNPKINKLGLGQFSQHPKADIIQHPEGSIIFLARNNLRIKHSSYSFENERRFIIAHERLNLDQLNRTDGVLVPLDGLSEAVEQVIVSPYTPKPIFDEVKNLIKEMEWKVEVKRSVLELEFSWKDLNFPNPR